MLRRYARAFWIALKYTLRGEKPPLLRVRDQYPVITAWVDETVRLVAAIERAAADAGVDSKAVTVRVDRRDVSMETILAAVKFHAKREYPSLMVNADEHSPLTLHATNHNDRYLVLQLANAFQPPLKSTVDALAEHLAALPQD
jgi:hypothetical protein